MKSDRQLKQDVIDELAWEPSVNDTAIGVEVDHGIVTLTGHLCSYAEKLAAEKAAQRVAGVKGLAIKIDVRLSGLSERTDAEIAGTASQGLEWNAWLPKDRFQVMVENGWVTVSGEVEHDFQRTVAENVLRTLMGVVGISNKIVVKPGVVPTNVKSLIEAALQRRAHAETLNITVTVDGDEVTLSGPVMSVAEARAAVKAAALAPGVTRVIDSMTVV